jgi:hypothetical protein
MITGVRIVHRLARSLSPAPIHGISVPRLLRAGKPDEPRMRDFLDRHSATMPRPALRYAIEHRPPGTRDHYLNRKKDVPARQ